MRHLVIFLTLLSFGATAYAEGTPLLENIDSVETKNGPQIIITFNHSVRYISHSPHTANDIFEIKLASTVLSGGDPEDLIGTETLQWSPSEDIPLFDIRYDSVISGRSRLTMRFQRATSISVSAGKDVRTLVIQLPKVKKRSEKTDQPPPHRVLIPLSVDPKLRKLMEEARQAVATKAYAKAIRLYEKVLRDGGAKITPIALEFLGVAREKNGQRAQAKAVYQRYLSEYPNGAATARVQQRLTGLVTAAKRPPEKLREAKIKRGSEPEWKIFGGVSQFYRRDDQTTNLDDDNEITAVTRSSLSTDLNVSGRLRTDTYSIRTRFSGGYEHNFLGSEGPGSQTRISSLYAQFSDRTRNMHLQAGRQSGNKGGVLGRFDGALFSMNLGKNSDLNLVAGYPVNSSKDGLNTDKYFFGMNTDFKPFGKEWDFNTFIIQQIVEGITDRQAIGGEIRFFMPGRSFFTLADYDIMYDELNIFLFLGHWTFPDQTTVNLSFDYRKSPLLTTSIALQGQGTESINTLLDTFSEDEIQQLAQDRTATSKLITVGASRPLMKDLQINGDITVSQLSGTDASGGVEATPDSGNDVSLNMQLIKSNWLKNGDIYTASARFSTTDSSNTKSFGLDSRYPVTQKLRISPRLRIDFRNNKNDDSDQVTYKPSMRLTHRLKKRFRLEAEAGGEWSNRELTDDTNKSQSWFINVGYRLDF